MEGSEQPNPAPKENQNIGLWERFRSRFRKTDTDTKAAIEEPTIAIDPLEQTKVDKHRIEELKEIIDESKPTPKWSEKDVKIDSINLRGLPVNLQALTNLGKAINEIKDDHIERKDLADIRPPVSLYPALPMVASVIASKRNPEIPVVLPTNEEVKAMKPYLVTIEKFIGRFSENLARKFGSYVERRGAQLVVDTANQVVKFAEVARTIENPQQQFLKEATLLYQNLQKPETEEGFWGETNQVKVEQKIYNLLRSLNEARFNNSWPSYTPRWLNSRDFPLLLKLLPRLNLPPQWTSEGNISNASIAGAELMSGLETFLKQQGIKGIGPAPQPREFNLLDPDSWGRGLAEVFAVEKLERVKNGLPNVLTQTYQALPQNGPQMADKIYNIAENVCILKAQGHSPNEIAQNMFSK